jgi:hypothetical protein
MVMPVKPIIRVIESGGWKKEQNKRFGAVVVGIFETYSDDGGVKTFQYAPTLMDIPVLKELIRITEEVDEANKTILRLKAEAENVKVDEGAGCFNG